MTACFAPVAPGPKLASMASIAVHHARHHGPRLIERQLVLFRQARTDIAELVGLVWLVTEVAELVRSHAQAPIGGRERTRAKEKNTWSQ